MSDNTVKYINFKYIILAPPEILIKIRHCTYRIILFSK